MFCQIAFAGLATSALLSSAISLFTACSTVISGIFVGKSVSNLGGGNVSIKVGSYIPGGGFVISEGSSPKPGGFIDVSSGNIEFEGSGSNESPSIFIICIPGGPIGTTVVPSEFITIYGGFITICGSRGRALNHSTSSCTQAVLFKGDVTIRKT